MTRVRRAHGNWRLSAVRSRAATPLAGRPARGLAVVVVFETLRALARRVRERVTRLHHLGWALAGTTLGTAVGVLPGIGPALTVAVLLPVTFNLDPISAFIMFGGIYYGAMYGGSTTSILLNTPGETGSIATAIDGYVMARQGRGAAALTTAAIGSFVAGTLATIALTFFAPALAPSALRFGPAEYFALTMRRVHHRVGSARRHHMRAGSSACSWAWRSAWSGSISSPATRASRSASHNCSTASMS